MKPLSTSAMKAGLALKLGVFQQRDLGFGQAEKPFVLLVEAKAIVGFSGIDLLGTDIDVFHSLATFTAGAVEHQFESVEAQQ